MTRSRASRWGRAKTTSRLAFALALACLAAQGCDDGGTEEITLPPPTGYVPPPAASTDVGGTGQGGEAEGDAASPGADGSADAAWADASDDVQADGAEGGGGGLDAGPGGPGDAGLASGIGGPCTSDGDCADLGATCVEWVPGRSLCSVLGCDDGTACPDGSACVPLGSGPWACVLECDSPLDCRAGFGCKVVPVPGAPLLRVCHAIAPAGAGAGAASTCSQHSQCSGALSCLIQAVPPGYCAQLDCGPARPCASGTRCVELLGVGTACLKPCGDASQCPGSVVGLQECAPMMDIQGQPADVCVKKAAGKALGDVCAIDEECATGLCELASTGVCLSGGHPCTVDLDCGPAGSCQQSASGPTRRCARVCAPGQGCADGEICVPRLAAEGGPVEGRCAKACIGLADVLTCDAGIGQRCIYGLPFDAPAGQGAYACARVAPGSAGAPCLAGGSCAPGLSCEGAAGGQEGMCVQACGAALPSGVDYCPWTTVCASTGTFTACHKLCPEKQSNCIPGQPCECPLGLKCSSLRFAAPFPVDVCTAP